MERSAWMNSANSWKLPAWVLLGIQQNDLQLLILRCHRRMNREARLNVLQTARVWQIIFVCTMFWTEQRVFLLLRKFDFRWVIPRWGAVSCIFKLYIFYVGGDLCFPLFLQIYRTYWLSYHTFNANWECTYDTIWHANFILLRWITFLKKLSSHMPLLHRLI